MPEDPLDPMSDSSSAPASAQRHRPQSLAASVLELDLDAEVEQLQQQASYRDGRPTGRTLVKEPDLRLVLMTLKGGARMEEHRASGPISIQALSGTIRLRLAERSVELSPGRLVMLEPGIPHDVDAVTDAAFLLTIGPTRYRDVSDHHEPRVI